MLKVGSFNNNDFKQVHLSLVNHFNKSVLDKTIVPGAVKEAIFPENFLSSSQYLMFPLFFRNAFPGTGKLQFNDLCIAGYLYFKYLICIDSLLDKDTTEEHENAVPENILLLRSHIYHEESLHFLSGLFPAKSGFWKAWKTRNQEFLNSILMDKGHNIQMPFAQYEKLSEGKCSFLKASIDAFYFHGSTKMRNRYAAVLQSLDHLATGRCLQDDFEDFKKDLIHKKNNYGHVLLNKWLKETNKDFNDFSPQILEKYFFISKVSEDLLDLSKAYFNKAIDMLAPHKDAFPEYLRHLEGFRNKSNLIKVNIEAYRVTKIIESVRSSSFVKETNLADAIALAESYIGQMQNSNGSWYDVSNKQGLSNVWSTGFIAMQLDKRSAAFKKSVNFLMKNKQQGLWGYNTDWLPDYDSTTCALITLKKAGKPASAELEKWFAGQQPNGGFSTYSKLDNELVSYLGFSNASFIKSWTEPHVCVSALAYYFLSTIKNDPSIKRYKDKLKAYLLERTDVNNTWQPYWWTSAVYPTVFVVKGLLNDGVDEEAKPVHNAVKYLLSRQGKDGSFKCDVLKKQSVFYTALVLNMLCSSGKLFSKYKGRAEKMKNWLLTKQFDNGAFESTDFLLIPFTNAAAGQPAATDFRLNKAGGTGSVTGEVAGLFSTAVAVNALKGYEKMGKSN